LIIVRGCSMYSVDNRDNGYRLSATVENHQISG
jgi:hypothetical protein